MNEKNGKADSGSKETDHRGGDRDEQHHESRAAKSVQRSFFGTGRYKDTAARERILHLERLGRGRQEWKFQRTSASRGRTAKNASW